MASFPGGSKAKERVHTLEIERQKQREEVERRKGQINSETSQLLSHSSRTKFSSRTETVEDLLKSDTVGLVRHEDYKARREYLQRCAAEEKEKRDAVQREREEKTRRERLQKANKSKLSFAEDDDSEQSNDDDDTDGESGVKRKAEMTETGKETVVKKEATSMENPGKKRRLGFNPDVDVSFLPDRERDLEEQAERERLKQQWLNEQEAIKKEIVRVTYSYWDGSGHRKMVKCKKGTTIGRFLAIVQTQFKELRHTSADSLMFIKEDLIIPHHYSFYDFIVTKARGKSGPLFNFDVVDEVRLLGDAQKEKEDAHAAKVVERRWYERNRHIFPASRWEVYDPNKTFSKYTIHGN